MKKLIAIALLLFAPLAALAVEDGQVEYAGGTVATISGGTLGRLDTTSGTALSFQYSGGSLAIPYSAMQSYQFTQEVAHHLGVAPAIAVGLVKKRQRRHYLRISYKDANGVPQAAVFEVSKQMPRTLMAVLQARAPQGCRPNAACAIQH